MKHNRTYRQDCWFLLLKGRISPQLALTVLNVRQQIPQKHPHSGGLVWVPGSIEGKRRDAGADLLQRQEGTLKRFGGERRGGEQGNRSGGDCSQCSHRHPTQNYATPA